MTRSDGQDGDHGRPCGCGFCLKAYIACSSPRHLSGSSNVAPSKTEITYLKTQGARTVLQQAEEPCFYEIKHPVERAESQGGIKFCEDFDKVLKPCKELNLIEMLKLKNWQMGFEDQVTVAKPQLQTEETARLVTNRACGEA